METLSLLIGLLIGFALGASVFYFYLKASYVPRAQFENLIQDHIRLQSDLKNETQKNSEIEQLFRSEQAETREQNRIFMELKEQLSRSSAENELKDQQLRQQNEKLIQWQNEKQELSNRQAELSLHNQHLQSLLTTQKEEIKRLQTETKLHFENLANKILEEKTSKFTEQNQHNLKNLLHPFQEKILELKNRVEEAYDKESKERFSLGERVKELAKLNQQISEDAQKLTLALKGDAKTQGQWGEMILENILEKSGLSKGREYFLEYQLTDENNQALFSEFSGKKMRPDAVIKYPDDRNVIIDAKVSLTAFSELINQNDPELYRSKLNQHLNSIKTHIVQLSQKAYDDYGKALDFVMMFIPSEPAYIAAMQADPDLWNFAYQKRILLLNPGNLITSLKLLADLWKREYQNRNAIEIAERGAKLYDKFVGFVETLEKTGKAITMAKESYDTAHKQLCSGRDNLVSQTQKMKQLGLKNKKELPQGLVKNSQEPAQ
ncbi:DNA recombination protein RmuC [Bergeyella sp. RCAD1439]|nr:DNA recombination protein RmuC [Bergeyella sp. RCAD1439]